MTKELTKLPSHYALFIIGTLIIVNIIIITINFRKIFDPNENPFFIILVITSVGLLIGVYGILHLGLAKVYHYNPSEFLLKKIFNKKQRHYPGLW